MKCKCGKTKQTVPGHVLPVCIECDTASSDTAPCDCSAIMPHSFFKTKSITSAGDRDKRGRFVKAEVVLRACGREEAEYCAGFIFSNQTFVLAKLPNDLNEGSNEAEW